MNHAPIPGCPANKVCPYDEHAVNRMAEQIQQIHTVIFGAEGQGGLHRKVEGIDRRTVILESFNSRLIGITAAIAAIVGFSLDKLWSWITK